MFLTAHPDHSVTPPVGHVTDSLPKRCRSRRMVVGCYISVNLSIDGCGVVLS